MLADNGYLNEEHVKKLAVDGDGDGPTMEILVSAHAEARKIRRRHDFRPSPDNPKEPSAIRSEFVGSMKERMEGGRARLKYRLRRQSVEPIFGTNKQWMGFEQFILRGLAKVTGEWNLASLA